MSEFYKELYTLDENEDIQILKNFSQHRTSTTYDHCRRVAEMSYKISQFFGMEVREKELARGAMLHDYYLYEATNTDITAYKHGTSHAQTALDNAGEIFDLTPVEENIIYSHMWPLNITHLPKTKEAALVSLSDKIVAVQEFLHVGNRQPAVAV